jgi:repressor LexA
MENLTPAQKELYDWLVDYIRTTQHAPSIRQMMEGMKLRSPAPVQSRLDHLRKKGYIDWADGKARTIRILKSSALQGIEVLGAIAAGGLVEPFTDETSDNIERFNLADILNQPNCFILRVSGDSMIEDHITDGDMVIMRSPQGNESLKDGEIVAARVEGLGTTLKHFYQGQNRVILKASNPKYNPIEVSNDQVEIQGILLGVWRGYY